VSTGRAPHLGPLLTAMITPFDARGDLDLAAATHLARHLVAQGNTGLAVAGSTGEGTALEDDEKLALFAAVKAAVGDSAAVLANAGSGNTRHSVALAKRAEDAGADAILAVVPYYCKPTQDGMMLHFSALAEATQLPIVVYNIPGRTGANMLPATLLELARRYGNIAGVKESSGDLTQFTAILRDRPPNFGFWCGDDHLFLPSLALGADGLISVAGHLCARELRAMHEAFERGDVARAARMHASLAELFAALFTTSNPVPMKWAMTELGVAAGPCRSPLGTLPVAHAERLRPLLDPYRERMRTTAHRS